LIKHVIIMIFQVEFPRPLKASHSLVFILKSKESIIKTIKAKNRKGLTSFTFGDTFNRIMLVKNGYMDSFGCFYFNGTYLSLV